MKDYIQIINSQTPLYVQVSKCSEAKITQGLLIAKPDKIMDTGNKDYCLRVKTSE